MNGMGRAIETLHAIKMACKEDPVEDLGHGVGGVCSAVNFEELQDTSIGPLLSGEILNVHVSGPAA
jgi:hypothetical protein